MKNLTTKRGLRCAIYTRVSTDQGLEQDFNSLDAQREASEAYIKSQAHEGWRLVRDRYDDGGFSGGSRDRPALQKLLIDVQARRIDVIVVYKVDRLTRSLADFTKLVETFDAHGVSFVSVTQSFNTTTSMGRLTLNVLLSFAQFEREVTGGTTPPIHIPFFFEAAILSNPLDEYRRRCHALGTALDNSEAVGERVRGCPDLKRLSPSRTPSSPAMTCLQFIDLPPSK